MNEKTAGDHHQTHNVIPLALQTRVPETDADTLIVPQNHDVFRVRDEPADGPGVQAYRGRVGHERSVGLQRQAARRQLSFFLHVQLLREWRVQERVQTKRVWNDKRRHGRARRVVVHVKRVIRREHNARRRARHGEKVAADIDAPQLAAVHVDFDYALLGAWFYKYGRARRETQHRDAFGLWGVVRALCAQALHNDHFVRGYRVNGVKAPKLATRRDGDVLRAIDVHAPKQARGVVDHYQRRGLVHLVHGEAMRAPALLHKQYSHADARVQVSCRMSC